MSFHEGESSSLDPSTEEKELGKSPVIDSTQKNDSGADDHEDISSHDYDMIAYESKESGSSSIDISSTNPVTDVEIVTGDTMSEPAIEVEVMEPRRSARDRKQTKVFGNPLLYRITYHLTPRLIPELLQHLSETMETLKRNIVVQWNFDHIICISVFMAIFFGNLRTYFFSQRGRKCEFVNVTLLMWKMNVVIFKG